MQMLGASKFAMSTPRPPEPINKVQLDTRRYPKPIPQIYDLYMRTPNLARLAYGFIPGFAMNWKQGYDLLAKYGIKVPPPLVSPVQPFKVIGVSPTGNVRLTAGGKLPTRSKFG